MDFIRRHMKTIFWVILLSFLFATFAYFGAGGYLTRGTDTIAVVNKERLSYSEYTKAVSRAIENYRSKKKDTEITDNDVQQIKREVLQDLVSEAAFYQSAKKYGFTVSDNEIRAYLQQIPAFQKNGHFDHQTYYQTVVYGLKMTPEEFENSRRKGLVVDKVRHLIFLISKVTDKEAEMEYLRRNGNFKNWDKEKDKFIETLRNEKRVLLFNQWITQLQKTTQIKDYLSKFEQLEKGSGRTQ